MTRILIRSAKDPFLAVSAEATLARDLFAGNVGNLLFTQAVHEVLSTPGTEVVSQGYLHGALETRPDLADQINEEYDAFVLPLANAFRPDFVPELRRLTALVRRLDVPVVVVGVGGQTSPTATELPSQVRADTSAFLRAVLDRSAKVGIRGDLTRRCLAGLGFGDQHVEVIGCPSLFMPGRDQPVVRRVEWLTPELEVAANTTLSQSRMGSILRTAAERYPRLTYIAQTRAELRLLLWGEPVEGDFAATMPTTVDHPLYRSDRIRMFVDPTTWLGFLGGADFSFGTRLHGNIAALLAGTPAFLLTFDSRTTEVAEHHALPHAPLHSVADDVDPAELHDRTDLTEFNARRPELLARYASFLSMNGLAHVFQPGQADPAFEARLGEIAFPGPVRTPFGGSDGVEELLARLRWLRQGDRADRQRTRLDEPSRGAPRRGFLARLARRVVPPRRLTSLR